MLRTLKSRIAVSAPIAVAAAVLVADQALAGATMQTTGGSLMCNVYVTGRTTGKADCWLRDTAADNQQVYAQTRVESFPVQRVTNSGGSDTKLAFTRSFWGDGPHWTFAYRVCRQRNLGSDNCSSWQRVTA